MNSKTDFRLKTDNNYNIFFEKLVLDLFAPSENVPRLFYMNICIVVRGVIFDSLVILPPNMEPSMIGL